MGIWTLADMGSRQGYARAVLDRNQKNVKILIGLSSGPDEIMIP